MAEKKVKFVSVKITANVAWKSNILKKDSVHEVSEDDALLLIEGKHAVEAPAPQKA
jgi:hypothetical protein